MTYNHRRAAAVLCAAGLALFSGCGLLPQEDALPPPPVYKADRVEYEQFPVLRGDLEVRRSVQCRYKAAVEENLIFKTAGLEIRQVHVSVGDTVEPGQLIASLDSTAIEEEIAVQEETAALHRMKRDHLKEKRVIERRKEQVQLEQLAARIKEGKATEAQYSSRKAAAEANEAAYSAQYDYLDGRCRIEQEKLGMLQTELENCRLYAGISGTVRLLGRTSELSSDRYAFAVISDYSSNRFVSTVYLEDMFAVGDKAVIRIGGSEDHTVDVTVTEIEDVSTEHSKKFTVIFQPDVPDPSLKAGDSGSISYLVKGSYDTLYLPVELVQTNDAASLVYYLDENGLLATKPVQTGVATEEYIEITEGLKEGDYVVDKDK